MNLEEMWARLAQHQPFADRRGYGPEWARMCAERSEAAARASSDAVWAAWASADWDAADALWATGMAAEWAAAWASWTEAGTGPAAAVDWIERSEEQK